MVAMGWEVYTYLEDFEVAALKPAEDIRHCCFWFLFFSPFSCPMWLIFRVCDGSLSVRDIRVLVSFSFRSRFVLFLSLTRFPSGKSDQRLA